MENAASPTTAAGFLEIIGGIGVDTIFGLPGVHNLPFWACDDTGLPRIMGVRHEQTAVYAADGYARATGHPGFALTTTGPGAVNAAGAFGEASASGSPVVLVASEIATTLKKPGHVRGVLHESRDQAAVFEPLAKRVFRPRSPADAVGMLSEAISVAMAWPRGPVYVDVPTDVLHAELMAGLPAPSRIEMRRLRADTDQMARLTELIGTCSSIVLWVGGGVVQSGAEHEVRELAERLNAPVVTTFNAKGVLPPDHELRVDLPPHEPSTAALIRDADLLLGIGSDFDGMMTRNWRMELPGQVAVINISAEDLDMNLQPQCAVVGDARAVLREVLTGLEQRPKQFVKLPSVDWGSDPDSRVAVDLVRLLDQILGPEHSVICDMAVIGYWYGGYGRPANTRVVQYPVGWGTLGYALPASIGPASTGRRTVVLCGDGGMMFAVGELATIVKEQLPVTVVVCDDAAYGMLAYDQVVAGHRRAGVDLLSPDWNALGAAFGIRTDVVALEGADVPELLAAAVNADTPRMLVLRGALNPPRTTSPRWI